VTNYYLLRVGDTDPLRSTDPYEMPLTPEGAAEVRRWAVASRDWNLQMLCTSTQRASLDTADLVEHESPVRVRWDLTELEDLVLDDLNYDPRATHLVSTWTPEQMEQGLISLWTRLSAAFARIAVYVDTYMIDNVVIVASERVLNLLLAHWLQLDWRLLKLASFSFERAPVCRIAVADDGQARIEWMTCPDHKAPQEDMA